MSNAFYCPGCRITHNRWDGDRCRHCGTQRVTVRSFLFTLLLVVGLGCTAVVIGGFVGIAAALVK